MSSGRVARIVKLTPRSWGGGQRYFHELALALARRHDVRVTAFEAEPPRLIRVVGDVRRQARWADLLTAIRDSDIVHVHNVNSLIFDVATVACKLFRKPLVLTDHGGGWYAPGRLVPRARLRAVSALAAVSAASVDDLGWPLNRPYVILYGGGDHVLRLEASVPRQNYDACDFLFVGRILPHKGIHLLIEALPPERSLRICGQAQDSQYLQSIGNAASNKMVQFNIAPPDADLAAIYRASSYTVLPSVNFALGRRYRRPELLGLTLLESAAVGTPFVSSGVGGTAEVVRMLHMPSWAGSDAAAIETFLRALPRPGSKAYEALRHKVTTGATTFTWDVVAARCVDLYTSLIPPAHR